MSLALLFHYLMLNMFRMLIHPSSTACDLFVELFHVLYCSGTMCVGVTLWFGWGGVVSGCRLPSETIHFLSGSISKLHSLRTFSGNSVSIATLLETAQSGFDLRKERIF